MVWNVGRACALSWLYNVCQCLVQYEGLVILQSETPVQWIVTETWCGCLLFIYTWIKVYSLFSRTLFWTWRLKKTWLAFTKNYSEPYIKFHYSEVLVVLSQWHLSTALRIEELSLRLVCKLKTVHGVFSRSGFPVEPLPAGSVAVCCSSLRTSESQNYCRDPVIHKKTWLIWI